VRISGFLLGPLEVLLLREAITTEDWILRTQSGKDVQMWRSAVSFLLAILLALALPSQPGFAQGNLADWKSVQTLAPGSGISVKTKAGKKYHGELVSVFPDSLLIEADEPAFPGRVKRQRELRQEDIREVRLLAPVASTLAGGAIGAGLGAGIGAGLESTSRSNEDRGLITVILAFLGAAIGAAIAFHSPIVKGKKVYEVR
jgi:hypothetical protein